MWYQLPDIPFYGIAQNHPLFDNYYDTSDVDIVSFRLTDSSEWSVFAFLYVTKIFVRYKTDISKVYIEVYFSTKELVELQIQERYLGFDIEYKEMLQSIENGEHNFESGYSVWICNKAYFGRDNPLLYSRSFTAPNDVNFSMLFEKPENETIFAFYMLPF
jgi:hypothetical protein